MRALKLFTEQLRWLGPSGRVAFFGLLLIGLYLGWASREAPIASDAERALQDLRVAASAEAATQNGRITLVTYSDETLRLLKKRSPLDRRMLAQALRALDQLGPKAIGIDILIDAPQDEDEELIATLRAMRTPVFLGFTTEEATPDAMQNEQESFLRDFLRQVSAGPVRPASVLLRPDPQDGMIRRWPEPDATEVPVLAQVMSPEQTSMDDYIGPIAFQVPLEYEVPLFTEVPIESFAPPSPDPALPPHETEISATELQSALRPVVEGRYILIGGNIVGMDDFETPLTQSTGRLHKGIEIHAQMLAQRLAEDRVAPVPDWLLWIAPVLLVVLGAATAAAQIGPIVRTLLAGAQIILLVAGPFMVQQMAWRLPDFPAFGWLAAWGLGALAAMLLRRSVRWQQGRVAQAALQRYLPPEVADKILAQPDGLNLTGEKRMIYILFSDMEGFTSLCHALPPAEVAGLLNEYLERLGQVVLDHGGTIDKFVGDAVVAFWGAPIAKPDDGERAALAAVAIHKSGEDFRRERSTDAAKVGRTRVGLHYGEAIVGNFGGEGRVQYTALGDSMNVAARLEAANKQLGTSILVSKAAAGQSSGILYRSLGIITVRGRDTGVEVAEPWTDKDPEEAAESNRLLDRAVTGDEQAISRLNELALQRPDDQALRQLVERLKNEPAGKAVVLG